MVVTRLAHLRQLHQQTASKVEHFTGWSDDMAFDYAEGVFPALSALLDIAEAADEVRQDGTSRTAIARLHEALNRLAEQQ